MYLTAKCNVDVFFKKIVANYVVQFITMASGRDMFQLSEISKPCKITGYGILAKNS